jgi:hypothetical protein
VFEFLTQDLSDEARQALVRAAHEPASVDSAIQALAARGDSESVRALSQLTNAADPELASRATCALLGAPDSRSRPLLIRAANRLPAEATAALLRIHAPEAHGALARLSVSSTPSERLEAERLTARYGSGS